MVKVSIIIPCYNHARYLSEAVDSVAAQSYKYWECIIVNDGSTDKTAKKARALIEKYQRKNIRLIEIKNGGLSNARNVGIQYAIGTYILPLDADDMIHCDMLKKTVPILDERRDISIVSVNIRRFGGDRKKVRAGQLTLEKICEGNQLNYCSLYRRSVWQAVGGYNQNMHYGYEDWDFWVGCAEKGFVAYPVCEDLFFHRVKHTSMYTEALKHDFALRAQIVVNHPMVYEKAAVRMAKQYLAWSQTRRDQRSLFSVNIDAAYKVLCARKKKSNDDYLRLAMLAKQAGDAKRSLRFLRAVCGENLDRGLQKQYLLLRAEVEHTLKTRSWQMASKEALSLIASMRVKTVSDIYAIASLYKRLNDYTKAFRWFQKVVARTHDNHVRGGAYFHLGELMLARTDMEQARQYFSACFGLIPQHAKAREYVKALKPGKRHGK